LWNQQHTSKLEMAIASGEKIAEKLALKYNFLLNLEFSRAPLIVIIGWTGSKLRILSKYGEWYSEIRFNSLIVASVMSPLSMTFTNKIENQVQQILQVLDALQQELTYKFQIHFHVFSNGGFYPLEQILMSLENSESQYYYLNGQVKSFISDSAPGALSTFSGSRAASYSIVNPYLFVIAFFITFTILLLLAPFRYLSKNMRYALYRVDNLKVFLNNPILVIFSKKDVICDYEFIKKRTEDWKNCGMKVETLLFENSAHVMHFKENKKEYTQKVKEFLRPNW